MHYKKNRSSGFLILCLVASSPDSISGIPEEITIEDKTTIEQVRLIQELEQEEKKMIFKMVETFLTKKKFKEFFQKNVAAL